MKHAFMISLFGLSTLLSGCGGSETSNTGTLSLNLTDAPIDNANKVVVEFTGVSVKKQPADGVDSPDDTSQWLYFPFKDPKIIDLLLLQGSQQIGLLTEQPLEVGTYSEVRLHVNALQDGIFDSFIELTDGSQFELDIPSGAQTGLKIKGEIVIPNNGEAAFTIDFDVRKSIVVQGNQQYKLKPVLHLTLDALTGHISGNVATTLLTSNTSLWTCSDEDPDSYNAVYVFSGLSATPIDINTLEVDREPVATSLVTYNTTSAAYEFEVGYLAAGDYTLAFTCHADAENIEVSGDDLQFIGMQNVTAIAGETVTIQIIPPTP